MEYFNNDLQNVKENSVFKQVVSQPIYINNKPTHLDYISAFSTLGAVIISILLGVIFPFCIKLKEIWKHRIKLKLKYIEYYYDKARKKHPTFFICFQNMYDHPLYIKNILFYIKFKTHVLPVILRLCTPQKLILPQLLEEKYDFYIAHDYFLTKPHPLQNEQEILNFINQKHELFNKISPYDKIKEVYLLMETNIGQIKINIPKWMRDISADEIMALYLQDIFKIPEKSKNNVNKYIDNVFKKYKEGRKKRKYEILKWKIEKFLYYISLDTIYENFKIMIQHKKKKSIQPPKSD